LYKKNSNFCSFAKLKRTTKKKLKNKGNNPTIKFATKYFLVKQSLKKKTNRFYNNLQRIFKKKLLKSVPFE